MTQGTQLSVSIIIPVYNGGPKFRTCLESILKLNPQPEECIVISDCSTDDSYEIATEFGMTVLKTPVQSGPAHARNIGAEAAVGNILFFIDSDVAVPTDASGIISSAFQQNPDLAAIIGSYDDDPLEKNFLSQYKNIFHHYTHQTSKTEASTFWGACGAIRKDLFADAGGFSEKYHNPSIEDIELGYRLKSLGHQILLMKELQIKHLKEWRILSLLKADFFLRALPWSALIFESGTLINDLNTKISDCLSVIFVYLALLSLPGILISPYCLLITCLLSALLILINHDLYRFFIRKRGLIFTLLVIPWHWFYYFYNGIAFLTQFVRHHFHRQHLQQ